MNDRDNPDTELQDRVMILFRLWDLIRVLFGELPKPEQVGPLSKRWVTHAPVQQIVPRLITRAAMQPVDAKHRVLIMHGLTAWAEAYRQLVTIASAPRDERTPEAYSEATASLHSCADNLARAVVAIRRSRGGRNRLRFGRRPGE